MKTRLLNPDGTYSRKQIVPDDSNGENAVFNIQEYFIEKLKKKYLEDMRKMHRKKQKKKQKVKLFSIKN